MAAFSDESGFDFAQIEERLRTFGLVATDHALAQTLQASVVRPHLRSLVRATYESMHADPGFADLLTREGSVTALLRRLTQQLISFGVDFDTGGYFEMRLRAGAQVARAGLPFARCAWITAVIQRQLLVFARAYGGESSAAIVDFVARITMLDFSLLGDGHRAWEWRDLCRSLNRSRQSEQRLRRQSRHDSLTGLCTRDVVLGELGRALDGAAGGDPAVCVIMVDIDHFKQVNDTLGHLAGDSVLRAVSERMRQAVRTQDLIGRYGGEEFVVVLRQTPAPMALRVADRLRQYVEATPHRAEGAELRVTVSQGVACARPGESASELLKRADEALYRAKEGGRNRVEHDGAVEAPLLEAMAAE